MFLYALIAGILLGFFYALMSLGLNLGFGVLQVVNIAHGDIVVLGAYIAYELSSKAHLNPLLGMLLAVPPAVILGLLIYYAIAPALGKSADPEMLSLILFFGISQVIEALETVVFGNNQKTISASSFGSGPVHILGQAIPREYVLAALVSIPVIALVFYYLYRSRLGLATRALMSSRDDAMAVGINVGRTSAISFGIALGLAASAGALSNFILGGTNPTQGVDITTTAFAVIIIGALGSPAGTLVGGLVYGLTFQFAQTYAPSWANLVPYLLLLIVMLVKPTGLVGKRVRYA